MVLVLNDFQTNSNPRRPLLQLTAVGFSVRAQPPVSAAAVQHRETAASHTGRLRCARAKCDPVRKSVFRSSSKSSSGVTVADPVRTSTRGDSPDVICVPHSKHSHRQPSGGHRDSARGTPGLTLTTFLPGRGSELRIFTITPLTNCGPAG